MHLEDEEVKKGDHKHFSKEKGLVPHVDKVARLVADKAGLVNKEIPWKWIAKGALFVYLILTCLVMFHRPDFVNITAAMIGTYIIQNPEVCEWASWRKYTMLVACTFLYDLIFLCFVSDSHGENESNGGKGSWLLYFSLLCCWISFVLRPFIALILWYCSHDFIKIIKGDRGQHGGNSTSHTPDQDDDEHIF